MEHLEKINKFIAKYQSKIKIFHEFAKSVQKILKILLEESHFHYQVINSREKSIQSLKRKLNKEI